MSNIDDTINLFVNNCVHVKKSKKIIKNKYGESYYIESDNNLYYGAPNKDNCIYEYYEISLWTEWEKVNDDTYRYCGIKFNKSDMEIVIARHNEDISWSDPYRDIRTIYNKGDDDIHCESIHLDNVGRESHTYIAHIVMNYDKLAKRTLFTQCIEFSNKMLKRSCEAILPISYYFYFGATENGFVNYMCDKYNADTNILNNDWKRKNIKRCLTLEEFCLVADIDHKPIYFSHGGIFSVSSELIRKRSKEYYDDLLNIINYTNNPLEGHYFERYWEYIFNGKKQHNNNNIVIDYCKKAFNGEIILLSGNYGYRDMILNAIFSLSKFGCKNILVCCLDIDLVLFLRKYKILTVYMKTRESIKNDVPYSNHKEFLSINNNKITIIKILLERQLNVLYTDSDVVYRSNPYEYISQERLEGINFMAQKSINERERLCAGIMYIRSTKKNIDIFNAFDESMMGILRERNYYWANKDMLDDQEYIDYAYLGDTTVDKLSYDEKIIDDILLIDPKLFINGYTLLHNQQLIDYCIAIHATWIENKMEKIKKFIELKMWYISNTNGYDVLLTRMRKINNLVIISTTYNKWINNELNVSMYNRMYDICLILHSKNEGKCKINCEYLYIYQVMTDIQSYYLLLRKNVFWKKYKYVMFLSDNVSISNSHINGIFNDVEKLSIDIAQPSQTPQNAIFDQLISVDDSVYRNCDIVELHMPIFKIKILENVVYHMLDIYVGILRLKSGSGLDLHWSKYANENKLRMCVFDKYVGIYNKPYRITSEDKKELRIYRQNVKY